MSKATLSASFPEEAYPLLVRTWMEWRLRRPSRDEERDRQRARELTYDAMEAPTTARALRLVRQALDLDPSNVDALQMLLDLSQVEGPERIQLLKTIVAIGAVDLGEEAFKKLVPHFWGFMETRPYMRARASLALALREAGQLEESALEYYAMLDLNPNDNQGMRYELLAVLFMLGRLKDARLLMSAYEKEYDYSVIWAWGRVLERALSPKAAGAAEALQAARKQNPHVEAFVRGHCPLPKEIPSSYSPGSLEEAQCYAQPLRQSWEAHPKALAWLTDQPEVG